MTLATARAILSHESLRHLAGGFVGGLLGILIAGYIHLWAIPVGCFIGAVVGFWPDVIWHTIKADHAWLKWPHPVTRMKLVALLLAFVFVPLNAVHIYLFYQAASWLLGTFHFIAVELAVMWGIGTLIALFFVEGSFGQSWKVEKWDATKFYTEWNRWESNKWGYLAKTAVDLIRAQIAAMALLLILFLGLIAVLVIMFTGILPVTVFYGAFRGMFFAARRGGYWTCFVVSVLVTSGMAYVMHPMLTDTKTLWITAFFAGCIAAATSEGLRQGFLWLVAVKPRVRSWSRVPLFRRTRSLIGLIDKKLPAFGETVYNRLQIKKLQPDFMRGK